MPERPGQGLTCHPGRGAILHDFPERALADPDFQMADLPVSRDYLRDERLGEPFIDYMASWDGFVSTDAAPGQDQSLQHP